MNRRYAQGTNVSADRSRLEIESTLQRYGANQFGYATDTDNGLAEIQFTAAGRRIRFRLQFPSRWSEEFTRTETGRERSEESAFKSWEQACRQRWRALALCIKAKLEAVESGISEFEDEFLANIVVPGGQTVSEVMRPQLTEAYESGKATTGIAGFLN